MLSVKKKGINRRKVVVYIRNGLTVEECRLAYDLSEALGIELIIGSDKLLKPNEIVSIIKEKFRKVELKK